MSITIKKGIGISVLQAARERLKRLGASNRKIGLAFSGGKDSLVLSDLIIKAVIAGDINPQNLRIHFVDEEAIYPCVERITKLERQKYLDLGVRFDWYCLQFKHFNCLNNLSKEETFITWDARKKDVWVRDMPEFAIKNSALYDPSKGYKSYQDYFHMEARVLNEITLVGVRVYESMQRRMNLAAKTHKEGFLTYPIYDWSDNDVWKYIKDHNIDIPDAYLYMYQVGVPKNKLRISQFFSIDTARSLSQMSKYYPNLWERVVRREPNAELALLYFDTEMFRRSKGQNAENEKELLKKQGSNYKEKALYLLKNTKFKYEAERLTQLIFKHQRLTEIDPNHQIWKKITEILVAGDPKMRAVRAVAVNILQTLGGNKK